MRCTTCGEPWDLDTLHDQIEVENPSKPWYQKMPYKDKYGYTRPANRDGLFYNEAMYEELFNTAYADFRKRGCQYFGASHNEVQIGDVYSIAVITEIMGDDVDGAQAMIEDFGL